MIFHYKLFQAIWLTYGKLCANSANIGVDDSRVGILVLPMKPGENCRGFAGFRPKNPIIWLLGPRRLELI